MDRLLSAVLDAHGGMRNWAGITRITARMSLGGPFWGARGWPDIYSKPTVTIDPHREHIRFEPFTAEDRASLLEVGPERVTITSADGQVIEQRLDPRRSFPRDFDAFTTPWDAIRAYEARMLPIGRRSEAFRPAPAVQRL